MSYFFGGGGEGGDSYGNISGQNWLERIEKDLRGPATLTWRRNFPGFPP